MPYSEAFKAKMVKKMVGPSGWTATALGKEVGVPQSTLSRWLRDALSVAAESKPKQDRPLAKKWTIEEKLRVVLEAGRLPDEEVGAFLRREGVREAQLEEWRKQAEEAFSHRPKRPKPSPEAKKVKALERELRRKEAALAEVTALLALKKKLSALWGDEDDDTDEKSGR